jgi:putative FmdB family regulatory protein
MPIYQFRCPTCRSEFEEKRSFARSDDPAPCPTCDTEASKLFGTAMFYAPGSAAKAMLEPKPAAKRVPASHGADCPCCSGRRI